jgi:hypothetical protein
LSIPAICSQGQTFAIPKQDRQRRLTPLSWSEKFDDPIPSMTTLQDAADHVLKLPKAHQQLPHWHAAVEALIMAAEDRGPLLHARVGMLRAMNHGHEHVFSDRKETHWGKRKLKRDE